MSVFICQMCKEPISNFICTNRLAMSIRDWLPSKHVDEFTRFHNSIVYYFNADHCEFGYSHEQHNSKNIVCAKRDKASVCAFCYISEVYEWLKERNENVAEQFLQVFSLGYKKIRYKSQDKIVKDAITESKVWEKDSGICDDCGEFSDELKIDNGTWVCKACSGEV